MLTKKIKIQTSNILDGYLTIPLTSNFSPEVQQYENIERNFDLTTTDIINPTIDYEKVKIYPINSTGDTSFIDSLNFRLHFFNDINNNWDVEPTKISNIGFTEADVVNRRKSLEKTFIRLSFYDGNDLKTQNLIYFSTIFVDSSAMYTKYLTDGVTISGLTSEFIVENPKLSLKIKSFEGYNLYLFKNDIPKDTTKTIYLRVDFNNASNGRSTLFTNGKPENVNGYTMGELYNNMFFKINCSYDYSKNIYLYSFDGLNSEISTTNDKYIKNVLNLDIYQAKVI